jgi:hypothetical protein
MSLLFPDVRPYPLQQIGPKACAAAWLERCFDNPWASGSLLGPLRLVGYLPSVTGRETQGASERDGNVETR